MLDKGFDKRVKVSEIIENQIPEFILSENGNFSEFLKQYYISQEFQGGPSDLSENLDQYIKLDNLTPENISNSYTLINDVYEFDDEIFVSSTLGFPDKYGLLKIDDEIITYTGITTNSFTGCIRGFSGIESYQNQQDQKELVFASTNIAFHAQGAEVKNLSVLFLKEFYNKIKVQYTPDLENIDFVPELNIGNFIKESKSLYTSKGTPESFRILFNILYGVDARVIDLEDYLLKSSSAEYIRRKILFCKLISGDPFKLIGQTLYSYDSSASGPISEVDIINKNGEYLYKISLFEGYDDKSLIDGEFKVTSSSKVIGEVSPGSSTITVDSTIGFAKSGTIISGGNTITYTDKSINQFFGCSGIVETIKDTQRIRADEYVYSYENGLVGSPVYLEVCGVLSNLDIDSNSSLIDVGDNVVVTSFGDYIINFNELSNFKQFAFNSWVYNTTSRYQIKTSNSNTSHTVIDEIDKSSIKPGDLVEILLRGTDTIIANAEIDIADKNQLKLVNLAITSNIYTDFTKIKIDFRRKHKFASSSSIPLKYENMLANVQNTYNEADEYMYVATNSLPDYTIGQNLISRTIPSGDSTYVSNDEILFPSKLPFITGEKITYSCQNKPISGLENGKEYFVKVTVNALKFYLSRSFIFTEKFIEISPSTEDGTHTFTISDQFGKKIASSKSLRKFPLSRRINNGKNDSTVAGRSIGTLINGVDISNYKSIDKIYYGPIKSKIIYNKGKNYDVVNPPLIEVSPSTGTTCLVQPVVTGSVVSILLNQKDSPVKNVKSVTLEGGNGSGAILQPILEDKFREVEFNAKTGISALNETITFPKEHYLVDGQQIVYNSNGNNPIGIGTFGGFNFDQNKTLLDGGVYYVKYINPVTIRLFDNLINYQTGINTVGFTTINNSGIHKFRTLTTEKVISDIKVLSPGSNYSNRKLIINPSGISTYNSTINFNEHGFSDGELVIYENNGSPIVGLSTSGSYYVLKVDENNFRLADSSEKRNYETKNYVKFTGIGTGNHIFSYPPITVKIDAVYNESSGIISATPVVRGEIDDLYIYENGSDYGSTILNYHKKPQLTIKTGKNGSLRPIISNGRIIDVEVESPGRDYYSQPDVIITGTGSGAKITVKVKDGKIDSAVVTKTGIGYGSDTTIEVKSSGSEFYAELFVRDLTINNQYRFGDEFFNPRGPSGISTDEVIYQVIGYNDFIRDSFKDNFGTETDPKHSPIIGWAYDGNPIYGPFGFEDPSNESNVKLLRPGYSLLPTSVFNRPPLTEYPSGIFVEDYIFNNSGDLDEHNGRFTKTPDFPNGIYAYFAGIQTSTTIAEKYNSIFPYFIGNSFKSKFIPEIINLNQDFDFNNSNLLRNTFPYRTGQRYSSNDYIDFVFDDRSESSIVEGINSGSIDSFEIINGGQNYKVSDKIIFNNEGTSGDGISAEVSEILGKDVQNVITNITPYSNSIITKENNNILRIYTESYHNLKDGEYVSIQNISEGIVGLDNIHKIGVTTFTSSLLKELGDNNTPGIVTDIYVSNIPSYASPDNTIGIGTELLTILNVFNVNKILRVKRGITGTSHSESSLVNFYPNSFTINVDTNILDSYVNQKVYFNPTTSIGVGTQIGISTDISYTLGEITKTVSVPTQSIYLPNHPFKTGQNVIISGISTVLVRNTPSSADYDLLETGLNSVYVIKKSNNYIGIATNIKNSFETNGLYFTSNGEDNYEYYFQSSYNQIIADVNKIETVVSISTNHNLSIGDVISLEVNPNLEVGIGTSTYIRASYSKNTNRLILNSTEILIEIANIQENDELQLVEYQNILNNYNDFDIDGDGIVTDIDVDILRNYLDGFTDLSSNIKFSPYSSRTTHNELLDFIELHLPTVGDGTLDVDTDSSFSSTDLSKIAYFVDYYKSNVKINTQSKNAYSTGDKIIFEGEKTRLYYVYKLDESNIRVCDTLDNCLSTSPIFSAVEYITTGKIGLVNPPIEVTKNNDLVFDVSDSSLIGKNINFFYDNNFINEFTSTGVNDSFNVVGFGTVGVSSTAKLILRSFNDINFDLFYALEDNGIVIIPDKNVVDFSRITYNSSLYNGSYNIVGIGSTTFIINPKKIPERLSYTLEDVDSFSYTTKSKTESGSISKIRKIFGGIGYEKLPETVGVASSEGFGAIIKLNSNTIGKVNSIRIKNKGYIYPSDSTLKPRGQLPYIADVVENQEVSKVDIEYGGQNYFSEPQLVLINSETRKVIDNGGLSPIMASGSIIGVNIIAPPRGLSPIKHEIYTINNSNGVGINSIQYSSSGIVTCTLNTPIIGFSTINPPFTKGDRVFVEGIENISGNGFNSEDYGYSFFKVANYYPVNPAIVEYDVSEYTNTLGIAKTNSAFAYIVNQKNYPTFIISQKNSIFLDDEILYVNTGGGYYKTDLTIVNSINNYIKIVGKDTLLEDYLIRGEKSGSIARIQSVLENKGEYKVEALYSYSSGWSNEIGALSISNQVTPDNNYYQNLSYSVKSPIPFDEMIDPVNRLVHTSGLKNFADVGITSSVKIGIGSTGVSSLLMDFVEEVRVDTINQYDLVLDYEAVNEKTKLIKFLSKKLSDYFECETNRVLEIDDISDKFSSKTFTQEPYLDILTYPRYLNYSRFLVQSIGINTSEYQIDDIIVLNDDQNTYSINRGFLTNKNSDFDDDSYVDISGNIDEFSNLTLRFVAKNFEDNSYNIKAFKNYFNTSLSGVGSTSIGFVTLESKAQVLSTGITTSIIEIDSSTCDLIVSEVLIHDKINNRLNFFEIVVDHDNVDTYVSEYFFDTSEVEGKSTTPISSFDSSISEGILGLYCNNESENSVIIKSKTTIFNTTSAGISTYRFKADDQPDGSERSCRLESKNLVISSASDIISVDSSTVTSVKSLIKIKNNDNTSVHQVMLLNTQTETYTLPKYYVSIGNTSGIGTFGSIISGSNSILKFYPDPSFTGDFEISSYSEILYTDLDFDNLSNNLQYGNIIESLNNGTYNALNSFNNDRLDFDLEYKGVPVFQKTFNPKVSSILNLSTGQFTIPDHFFSPNEELVYEEGSTFIGVNASPLGIGETLSGGSVFVGDIIVGFSTITGVTDSDLLKINQTVIGNSIPPNTTIVSIANTYQYFLGNVSVGSSNVITGVSNTSILSVGYGIFSVDGTSLGTVESIGINSVTSSNFLSVGTDNIYYTDKLGIGVSLSNVATATTFRSPFTSGILTDKCPSRVYVIKIDPDNFKLTATKNSGIALTFTNYGEGNAHTLTMNKRNEKSLISVDGIVQYPILFTSIEHLLDQNINSTQDHFRLSGISSINPGDLLKINEEYCGVINVGFGTTSSGPVSGVGTETIVQVNRGFVGSSSSEHNLGTSIRIYRGSYNIVGNKIFFTEAPKGTGQNEGKNNSNLPLPKSSFSGRVFLRNNYSTNIIYDEFSESFTGIGRTYVVKYRGQDVDYVEPGSGIFFVNQIFQTPTTENNQGNNYELDSDGNSTDIIFSGIRSPITNLPIVSETDVNQNQLPRGGIIISIGSTSGLGFAPLVGASVTAVVGAGGSIVSLGLGENDIVGSGYRGGPFTIKLDDEQHDLNMGSDAIITATVGAGGSLAFTVGYGGTGYSESPRVIIPEPSYENLPVIGVSRLGIGETTQTGIGLSITVDVGPVSTTGIGSTLFEVKTFNITKLGYGFKRGDVFKPIGLVTDRGLSSIIKDFEITVLSVFNDSSALWQFGELDYIDSVSSLQDGIRKRFPLYRNNQLLSFEIDENDPDSRLIEFNSLLIIFINGVLQKPGSSYSFDGGTSFIFSDPPKPEDQVDIFFYRGTRNEDSFLVDVKEVVKSGDVVQIKSNTDFESTVDQDKRIVFDIVQSDLIETNVYFSAGINTINPKPINIIPQKIDKIINTNPIYKSRDSLTSLVFPSARIIQDIKDDDIEIFIDDAEFFNYEETDLGTTIINFDSLIVDGIDPVFADIKAIVSSSSTISLEIINGGSGYKFGEVVDLSISKPFGSVNGIDAKATANVSTAGTISDIQIINPGFGYTITPQVIAPLPEKNIEIISKIEFAQGFSGIITGITTTSGIGTDLALKFYVNKEFGTFEALLESYPILITDTTIGNGVTSINSNDNDIVNIGTEFLDNIYKIHSITRIGTNAEIITNVKSDSNIIGISTFGNNIGRFSWGRISFFERNDPKEFIVSGNTVNSGLSTFPQIQRRNYGLRNTGSLSK